MRETNRPGEEAGAVTVSETANTGAECEGSGPAVDGAVRSARLAGSKKETTAGDGNDG